MIQRLSDCKAGQNCLNNPPATCMFLEKKENAGENIHLFCVSKEQISPGEPWNLLSPCKAPALSGWIWP